MRFYDQALLLCVVPNRRFLRWNAQEKLGNATWEWPEPWQPVDEAGSSMALVNDLKALEAYEARQPEITSIAIAGWKTTDPRDLWL